MTKDQEYTCPKCGQGRVGNPKVQCPVDKVPMNKPVK